MTVPTSPIRVQTPGGARYAAALREAASKTGARSGLPESTAAAFARLVDLAVDAINSGGATTITLEMRVHADSLEATVVGAGGAPTKKRLDAFATRAAENARSSKTRSTKSACTITFAVGPAT